MLIPHATLARIQTGEVTLAFRRWDRPRVKAGTRLRTFIGLVEITSVEAVTLSKITAADAHQAGFATRTELLAFLKKEGNLYRIGVRFAGADPRIALREDAATDIGPVTAKVLKLPWAATFLRLIAEQPAVRAPDLAAQLGWETVPFKRNVRRLKELGLTESLPIGYQLSPRGQVILDALAGRGPADGLDGSGDVG